MPAAPVLILGYAPRVATTIARSLHRKGIEVDVAQFSAHARPAGSFAIRHVYHLPEYDADPSGFIQQLARIIAIGGHDTLFPGSDDALEAVVQHEVALRGLLRVGCPSGQTVKKVLDKNQTLEIAGRCGVPVPRTYSIDGVDALEAIRDKVLFPVVAKQSTTLGRSRIPVRLCNSYEQLRTTWLDDGADHHLIFQEFCPGVGVGIETIFVDGEPIVLFQHRRLRELPAAGGVSVLAVSEPVDHKLAEYSIRLLSEIKWDGVAMVEFRQDPESGRVVLMEINGRFWGSLALSQACGLDFPFYMWQVLHGEAPNVPKTYVLGQKIRWTIGDLVRCAHVCWSERHGRGLRNIRAEIGAFCSEFLQGTPDAIWSLRDPAPAILEAANVIFDAARRRLQSATQSTTKS